MHYRTLSILITAALFLLLAATAFNPAPWLVNLSIVLVPVLIIGLAIGILRAAGVDREPPAKNKWYHF